MSKSEYAFRRGACVVLAAVLLVLLAGLANKVHSQDTTVFIDLPDIAISPGQTIAIPVNLTNFTDTIEAYTIRFTLSRPGLVEFLLPPYPDTLVICNDPPNCCTLDTLLFPDGSYTTAGTLTESWDLTTTESFSVNDIKVTGFSDFIDPDQLPDGIPPLTVGEDLVKILTRFSLDPDTLSGNTVEIVPFLSQEFSTPDGVLITPVSTSGGQLLVTGELQTGDLDHNGQFDVFDVINLINCVFRDDCSSCTDQYDLNCDESLDVFDVIVLVSFVFRDGPQPGC